MIQKQKLRRLQLFVFVKIHTVSTRATHAHGKINSASYNKFRTCLYLINVADGSKDAAVQTKNAGTSKIFLSNTFL